MTLPEAIAVAERTGEAFQLSYPDGDNGAGRGATVSLCLDYAGGLLHFWEVRDGAGTHSGLLVHVNDLRSDRWHMRPAPTLSNLWRPKE